MSTPAGQYPQPSGQPGYWNGPQSASTGQNGLAVAGFVLGLIALLLSWVPVVNLFGDFLAVLGLVFGGVGMAKGRNKGLAIAAVVMSICAIGLSIVMGAAFAASMSTS